jgi:hypothetical protein
LVAAAIQVSTWDFKEVIQWAGKKGIEWTLVPTGGQHFNGQAERMIGLIKKQLWKTFEGKRLSHEETLTLLVEAVQKIKSRPITWNPKSEGEPLCVQDLMLGRAKPGQVEVKFETGKQLTRRFENVQGTKQEFWKRWIEEVFPEMLKQSKWKRDKRDIKVGDIVLRKDETAAGQTYKYAKVIKVHVSTDGRVRAADIEYKLPGESVFRTTTRPIHKLVLVIPVEEQAAADVPGEEKATAGGQGEERDARAEEPAPLAVGEPGPPQQEEVGAAEMEENFPDEVPQGATPQPTKEKQKEPKVAVKYKKVIYRKKAGERARTIIVSLPKEEEEIVDVGVRRKKRGRPKKTPETDPPDPCKGSVPDPSKGVCADPVNGAAILGKEGPDPQGGNKGRQLSPDKGREKT